MTGAFVNLHDDLQRSEFEKGEEVVKFRFTKSFEGYEFAGISIPSTKAKQKIEIPRFVAESLVQENIGIIEEVQITLNKILDYMTIEVTESKIAPLPEFFLLCCRSVLIKDADESVEEKTENKNLNKYNLQMKREFENFLDSRTLKILRRLTLLSKGELIKSLTVSEKLLVDRIRDVLYPWRDFFQNQKKTTDRIKSND